MKQILGIGLGSAYVLGLLLGTIAGTAIGIPIGAIVALGLGIGAAFFIPRVWRSGIRSRGWLLMGLVSMSAVFYLQFRSPHPAKDDVSLLVSETSVQSAIVQGWIDSSPRLTRSQNVQFWLKTVKAKAEPSVELQSVTGRLYVTVPLLQGTGLRSGQAVAITGSLYKPKPVVNPGGFNFVGYLEREGGFAGLRGAEVQRLSITETEPLSLQQSLIYDLQTALGAVRQRIVRAQVQGLGSPEGFLVSGMVLGRRAIDLPSDLNDEFTRAGLAHTLAASGFQVSLIFGIILSLARRLSNKTKAAIGLAALLTFIGLTGLEPSVLRAGLMGIGVLIGMLMERKVKPLGALLLTAAILLIYEPLWLWDLGFQLSFLATLGLLVTVPVLLKRLDWMPPTLATLIAVPIAAYLWTIPLQLRVFGVVSPYSIPVNVLTTPFVTIASLGGMVSAAIALIHPPSGSFAAWLLAYPVKMLIAIARFCNQMPGNAYAVGTIALWQTLGLYGLYGLLWTRPKWQRRWWLMGMVAIGLVFIPAIYAHTTRSQITILATSPEPVMIVQHQGSVGVINSSDERDVQFSVLPFLKKQGVNHVDWAIAATQLTEDNAAAWYRIATEMPIRSFWADSEELVALPIAQQLQKTIQNQRGRVQALVTDAAIAIDRLKFQLVHDSPTLLQMQIDDLTWLFAESSQTESSQMASSIQQLKPDVVWWSGSEPDFLGDLRPAVAIAPNAFHAEATLQQQCEIYVLWRDGAVQWTPQRDFTTMLQSRDAEN